MKKSKCWPNTNWRMQPADQVNKQPVNCNNLIGVDSWSISKVKIFFLTFTGPGRNECNCAPTKGPGMPFGPLCLPLPSSFG
jgi:hypothetical protein